MEGDLEELIPKMLSGLDIPVKYWQYKGKERDYVVYNEASERATHYEDNMPLLIILDFQVHLFTGENSCNRKTLKSEIRKRLTEHGITIKDVSTLHEEETKVFHITFECRAE